jgi:hypothetical protein
MKVKFKKDKGDLKKGWVLDIPANFAAKFIKEGVAEEASAKDSVTPEKVVNDHLSKLRLKRDGNL